MRFRSVNVAAGSPGSYGSANASSADRILSPGPGGVDGRREAGQDSLLASAATRHGRARRNGTNRREESLSASRFATARDVMRLNEHIRGLTGRSEEYGGWYWWLSIPGTPRRPPGPGRSMATM